MLKVCDTAREARHILNNRGVLVDGRVVTDAKFPVGLMDVLTLKETKAHYRMLVNLRGRMSLVPIEAAEANWKLCRVEDKTTVRGGKTQLNLHDGRNILLPKDAYKTGATLRIQVPDQKVVEHYELGKGAPVLVTAGFSTDIGKVFVVGTQGPAIKTPEVSAI
jgi:small subunit ribosomal protein S4e